VINSMAINPERPVLHGFRPHEDDRKNSPIFLTNRINAMAVVAARKG